MRQVFCTIHYAATISVSAVRLPPPGNMIAQMVGLPPNINLKIEPDKRKLKYLFMVYGLTHQDDTSTYCQNNDSVPAASQLQAFELNSLLEGVHHQIRKLTEVAEDRYASVLRQAQRGGNGELCVTQIYHYASP